MSSFASVRPAVRPRAASGIRVQRLAGAAFILMAGQFMTAIMLAASIAPGYDVRGGAISDLGVIPATAGLFNASLAAVGVLNLAGGWWLFAGHRRASVLAVFVVGGVGALGAALVPLDRGDMHSLFALAAFVAFNVEPIAVGALERGWVRIASILVGMVGLVFVGLMVVGDGGNPAAFGAIGHGGTERMIVYPVMLWLLAFGGWLTARDRAR